MEKKKEISIFSVAKTHLLNPLLQKMAAHAELFLDTMEGGGAIENGKGKKAEGCPEILPAREKTLLTPLHDRSGVCWRSQPGGLALKGEV